MYIAKNEAYSTLASSITSAATSLSVAVGTGDRFPVIAGSDYTYLTLEDASGNREIIQVTARASGSDVMTIVRGIEGYTARSWAAGSIIDCRPTAALMQTAFAHPGTSTGAHAATAISVTPTGNIASTNVQAALAELDTEKADQAATTAALAALLVSPTFTGDPKAPTPTAGDNDTSIATTAFVQAAIQTTGKNSQGAKTVSTSAPSGGADGDIWYQY